MPARIDDLLVLNANLNKSDFAKYLRDREAVLPTDFGGLGDGVANDRSAIQSCFDRAAADQKFAVIPPGTWNVGTVTTLSTLTTCSTLTNQSQVGGYGANDQIPALMHLSADSLRRNITVS